VKPRASYRQATGSRSISDVGVRIREMRRTRGLALVRLAESAAISRSALSQIEVGRTDPSLQTLRRLAASLQIPLAALFETQGTVEQRVVRAHERKILSIPRNRLRYELLTPTLKNKRVEFLRVEFDVDRGGRPELYAHDGQEYGFVIHGRVEVCLDGTVYRLNHGDSIFFSARIPHFVRNAGRRRAVMVWAISPPRY
jgi:transcriptional regulator with XRE-family HTH domain